MKDSVIHLLSRSTFQMRQSEEREFPRESHSAGIRVAALYDIHANLPALEAILEDVRRSEIECLVIGGDVFPGPMPRETLECLLQLDLPCYFIQGNGDREVLAQMRGEVPIVPEQYKDSMRWVAAQVSPVYDDLIPSWPATVQLNVAGLGEVLFCHATPRNDTEIFTRHTSEDRLLPVFEKVKSSVVVCGHTHMQFDINVGPIKVVNAGSVGMPFGDPGAYWLQLGPSIQLRYTGYDLAAAAERIRLTSHPLREEFAARNILKPPSEEQMLEVFGQAELR